MKDDECTAMRYLRIFEGQPLSLGHVGLVKVVLWIDFLSLGQSKHSGHLLLPKGSPLATPHLAGKSELKRCAFFAGNLVIRVLAAPRLGPAPRGGLPALALCLPPSSLHLTDPLEVRGRDRQKALQQAGRS